MLFKSSFCSPPHFTPTFCFIASSISLPPGSQPSWPALSRAHKHIFCDVCQLPGLAWLTLAQLRLQFSVDQCWAVWPHWNNQMVPSLFQAFPGSPEQQAPPPPRHPRTASISLALPAWLGRSWVGSEWPGAQVGAIPRIFIISFKSSLCSGV